MNFGLSQEISKDILQKSKNIHAVSDALEIHFKDRDYGGGVETITIGIICVRPEFDNFFITRKHYSKPNNLLEYDIKIDHEKFKNASGKQIIEILGEEIVESIIVVESLNINNFDYLNFRADLLEFFRDFDFNDLRKTAT
jgi:hypothetical protein